MLSGYTQHFYNKVMNYVIENFVSGFKLIENLLNGV